MLDFIAAGALFDAQSKSLLESTVAFRTLFGENISLDAFFLELHIDANIKTFPFAEWTTIRGVNYFLTLRLMEDKFAIILYNDPLLEELYTTLVNESLYDTLTKGMRKSHGESRIYDILTLYTRHAEHTFSILIYDIDYFKKVNDTYGHLAGDFILKELSKRVKSTLRTTDVFIRFGGEEFLILLPMTKVSGSMLTANRILEIASKEPFVFQNQKISLTVSIGITSPLKSDSLDVLLERADKALYKAKASGRNRIEYL